MSKNILEVCLSPNLGGLELFLFHCYNNFKQKSNCKIAIAKDKKLDKYFQSDDKFYIQRSKLFPFIPALKLAKVIDENEIDIVHFHWTKDIITVVLAKLLSKRKPKIVQSRHMGMTRFKDDVYHRWLYKNIALIHSITKQVSAQLEKFIPQQVRPKIELVYLGVKAKKDVDVSALQEKYKTDDAFIVGIIGRIQEGKDQHVVIEAVSKLKSLNIMLFVVGESMDDEYLQKLHDMCRQNGIEDKVVFTGFTKEVDAFMQLCDVTVLATKNEAFGLVIIESMANATPVIATDRGGPLEIIDNGVDGLLYDGSSDDLARKIELLYNDDNLREQLAQNSLKKVQEKFDFDKQLDKLYEVITRDENEVKF